MFARTGTIQSWQLFCNLLYKNVTNNHYLCFKFQFDSDLNFLALLTILYWVYQYEIDNKYLTLNSKKLEINWEQISNVHLLHMTYFWLYFSKKFQKASIRSFRVTRKLSPGVFRIYSRYYKWKSLKIIIIQMTMNC